MSLSTFILELALIGAGAYGLRQRRHWLFILALAAGIIGSIVSIVQYAVTGGIWWFAPWDIMLALATISVAVAAVAAGPHGAQIRNRFSSTDAEFDRELYRNLVELGDILNNGPERQDPASIQMWITRANERCLRVLGQLERMNAPSRDWNDLRDAYVDLTRKTVAALPSGVTPDERRMLVAEGAELSRQYETLRLRVGEHRRT